MVWLGWLNQLKGSFNSTDWSTCRFVKRVKSQVDWQAKMIPRKNGILRSAPLALNSFPTWTNGCQGWIFVLAGVEMSTVTTVIHVRMVKKVKANDGRMGSLLMVMMTTSVVSRSKDGRKSTDERQKRAGGGAEQSRAENEWMQTVSGASLSNAKQHRGWS